MCNGSFVKHDDAKVSFSIQGGELLAASNADPTDPTPSSSATITTFRGTALAIVGYVNGISILSAKTNGLPEAHVRISSSGK